MNINYCMNERVCGGITMVDPKSKKKYVSLMTYKRLI